MTDICCLQCRGEIAEVIFPYRHVKVCTRVRTFSGKWCLFLVPVWANSFLSLGHHIKAESLNWNSLVHWLYDQERPLCSHLIFFRDSASVISNFSGKNPIAYKLFIILDHTVKTDIISGYWHPYWIQLRPYSGICEPLKLSSANRRWVPITGHLYQMHNLYPHFLLLIGNDPVGRVFKKPISQTFLTSYSDILLKVSMGNFFQ